MEASNPVSKIGPWEPEEVVLSGVLVPIRRPKWHQTYKFSDGGIFKFWQLYSNFYDVSPPLKHSFTFREKVGYWIRCDGEELAWSIQDRICFLVNKEKDHPDIWMLDKIKSGNPLVTSAEESQIDLWLSSHPKERLIDFVCTA